MFGLFKRKSVPDDLSKLTVGDIKALLAARSEGVHDLCKRAAVAGSVDAAVFLSTASLYAIQNGQGDKPGIREQYVRYTEIAANLGDNGSRFNLGKHYLSQTKDVNGEMGPEEYEALRRAEHWYKLAAAESFQPAVAALREIAPVLEWAHKAFKA